MPVANSFLTHSNHGGNLLDDHHHHHHDQYHHRNHHLITVFIITIMRVRNVPTCARGGVSLLLAGLRLAPHPYHHLEDQYDQGDDDELEDCNEFEEFEYLRITMNLRIIMMRGIMINLRILMNLIEDDH